MSVFIACEISYNSAKEGNATRERAISRQEGKVCRYNQGRLNQWAHWARVQGPRIFFIFEGSPTDCGEIIFLN